jgi:hypothetical protein
VIRFNVAPILLCSFFCCFNENMLLGQNAGFIPGDAFFSSTLSEEKVSNMTGPEVEFDFEYPKWQDFGGYYGFARIKVTGIPDKSISDFKKLYHGLRRHSPKNIIEYYEDGRKVTNEIDPFMVLIYNKDTDFSKVRIGLKFNENWNKFPDDALSRDSERAKARITLSGEQSNFLGRPSYTSFLQSYEEIQNDLRNAELVPALSIQLPEVSGWAVHGAPLLSPVQCEFSSVQFVILESEDLKRIFNKRQNSKFYVISEEGCFVHEWKKRKLTSESFDFGKVGK